MRSENPRIPSCYCTAVTEAQVLGPSEAYAITSEGQTAFFWAGSSGLKPGSSAQGFLRVFKMVLSINEGRSSGDIWKFWVQDAPRGSFTWEETLSPQPVWDKEDIYLPI